MHPRLKKIIFDKLYEDLKNVEIIPYKESIWFIDREKKYWYLEYEKNGRLFWRYKFFEIFFLLFYLKRSEYERVIADWVEEVLNSRVNTTTDGRVQSPAKVEEVLNSRVNTTVMGFAFKSKPVEEVLNSRVNTTINATTINDIEVEEVLNFRVNTTQNTVPPPQCFVGEVLNSRVNITRTDSNTLFLEDEVEDILNSTL